MNVIRVDNPGTDYRLSVADAPRPDPGKGEILIHVAAAGVNRADILQARGLYPPPPGASDVLGLEVSGEVAAVGEGVSTFRIGDVVCALLSGGGYAEFCAVSATAALPVPQRMDLIYAASLPEAFFTVWANLFMAAGLGTNETVLIHGGSSGIGTAAIQICSILGHNVFTTARTPEKCDACLRLGAQRAVNYRQEDFVSVINAETKGGGVDVILDMVGGDYIQRNIAAAALRGRIVNIAYQKGAIATVNFAPVLAKRLSLIATTLRSRSSGEKAEIRDALQRTVWPLLESGRIMPVVDRVFPLAQAQMAHARMLSSEHIGKILLEV